MIRAICFGIFGLFLSIQLSSCASMMKAHCNYDEAFRMGMNDANSGQPMRGGVDAFCDEGLKEQTAKGYREGYIAGKGSGPQIQINIGGNAAAKKDCIDSYGKKVCGYNCKQAYGKAKCAQNPMHNCVEGFGDIRCGKNCRVEYGSIKCD